MTNRTDEHLANRMNRRQIQETLGLKHEDQFRKTYLLPTLQVS